MFDTSVPDEHVFGNVRDRNVASDIILDECMSRSISSTSEPRLLTAAPPPVPTISFEIDYPLKQQRQLFFTITPSLG